MADAHFRIASPGSNQTATIKSSQCKLRTSFCRGTTVWRDVQCIRTSFWWEFRACTFGREFSGLLKYIDGRGLKARVSAAFSALGNPSRASHLFSLVVSIKTLNLESSFPFASSVFGRRNMASSVLSDRSSPATARLLPFQRSAQSWKSQFQRSVSIAWKPLRLNVIRSTASPHRSLSAVAPGISVDAFHDSTPILFRAC